MSAGQVRDVCRQIQEMGGVWVGHPGSVEHKFGVEVPWEVLKREFPGTISPSIGGRVTVRLPGFEIETVPQKPELEQLNPKTWADFAAKFLLAETTAITPYKGNYPQHRELIDPLGEAIDYAISAVHYPPVVDNKQIYKISDTARGLFFSADGKQFTVFGAEQP